MQQKETNKTLDKILKLTGSILILILVIFISYKYYTISKYNFDVSLKLTQTNKELELLETKFKETQDKLINEQIKNDSYLDKIDDINKKVSNLEKVANTDKELLQKYSKVFFLNEHYKPAKLENIIPDYLIDPKKQLQIHFDVWPHLKRLLRKAERDGMDLKVLSAYRSFETQKSLKSNYKIIYGSGTANQFSADQGYSEHQLGTTVDFTTTKLKGTSESFKNTPEYKWLLENAYRYGFILSYPPNNKYYVYEPWHWRFVGETLSEYLYDEGKNFYDLDQREIDEYLLTIFD